MKNKWLKLIVFILIVAGLITGAALAEDGELFRRNISKTPEGETEKSAIFMMDFYVPAQHADGTDYSLEGGIPYYLDDGLSPDGDGIGLPATDYPNRFYAKPLISVWIDDREWEFGDLGLGLLGGVTFGEFDAFVGYSLDDGTTWREENLSRSADLSSFTLDNGEAYPGDVHNVVHQVAEDKILVVWVSKYCQSGFPLYAMDPVTDSLHLTDLETTYGKNALYLYDFFGVAGNQGSVDYTEQGYPEVGEIPYSCVWAARGKLLPGDDPTTAEAIEATHIVWTKPERLTSGVRDANLPAVDCAKNAGCALTWQEDPEGLRPGQGLGPGEGWSGAIANAKTDIWYSYITFADFDYVLDDVSGTAMLIEDYELAMGTEMDMPKPYVPMAIPVRLTDNDMCKATAGTNGAPEDPFCWTDFDSIDDLNNTNITTFFDNLIAPESGADFCNTTADWMNPGGTTLSICVTEDQRWMIGRVGATRVRMVLKPYTPPGAPDHDLDGVPDASAWLSLGAEETKALGITADELAGTDPVDIGKDMYYYSFDYAKPYNLHVNTALDAVDDSAYIVQQGGMLNQPAKCSPWYWYPEINPDITCPAEGEFFDIMVDEITLTDYYLTEISRRFAMTLNNIPNITNAEINTSGLAGMLIYKQGTIWQGGPADIMLRRLVVQDGFDATVDNPFAFENMACENADGTSAWLYTDDTNGGVNPNYLKGLCMAPAINISGTTIKTCTNGSDNDTCALTFPVEEDGTIYENPDGFPKVFEWRQCDGVAAIDSCDNTNDAGGDLDDQSWENPFDVAKGHRGFLYGDMVMMMYAWSPNWQANAVGNDHYNLYARRSFDGGETWTTTPADWCGPTDGLCGAGVDALEYYYGETIGTFVPYIWQYEAGAFEQARNLSLLHGNKVTILDPRYSPGGGLKQYTTIRTDWLEDNGFSISEELPYLDDLAIDPSKFYMVYETGDNTTVDVGEAVPLDLFYSRATVFGDTYEWYDYANDAEDCNPEDGVIGDMTSCVEPRFPWLENALDDLSGEASVVMNPGGTFIYNVWNQWKEEITYDEDGEEHELVYDSDTWFRRLLYLPDWSSIEMDPIGGILYESHDYVLKSLGGDVTFIGTGRDIDNVGDGGVTFEWYSSLDGVLSTDKTFTAPVETLSDGVHTITFTVLDDEGAKSRPISFKLWVADEFFTLRLPMVVK